MAACALTCTLAAPAFASDAQESILQDDSQLIYASPTRVANTLKEIAALGVDRIRVSVVWSLVAPGSKSAHRPKFDATDPSAYPSGAWDRYDYLVRLAQVLGIQVYFQLTAPAPLWATPPMEINQGYRYTHNPSAKDFGEFAEAVGRRYNGSYVASYPANDPPPSILGVPLPNVPGQPDSGGSSPVPRVSYWAIWNEPNIGGWMTPQWRKLRGGRFVEAAPVIYRRLVDAAWHGLQASGHQGDTILIGETAAYGAGHKGYGANMHPMTLLRALYCVDTRYQPVTGQRARELSCPTSGGTAAFVAKHPGLFGATGWAHHPYDFKAAPAVGHANPDIVSLADLPRLERGLDRIFSRYGQLPAGGVPVYLTEWGYETDPPNPYVKFSQAQQALWLNQGEFMTFHDPRVRTLGQFLLVDSPPKATAAVGSREYWGVFDSGLVNLNGSRKPAYYSYRIPVWLPNSRHGPRVAVWGQLRPADHSTLQYGVIEFRPRGSNNWNAVREVQTDSAEGFVVAHVPLNSAGQLRLGWLNSATGNVEYSRVVAVR
jgi:hypothetical protein